MSTLDRERVLKHPDLAQKLTEPPLKYDRPGQWTGFIPPDTFSHALNLSPEREALIALAREAYERERADTNPAGPTDTTPS